MDQRLEYAELMNLSERAGARQKGVCSLTCRMVVGWAWGVKSGQNYRGKG